MIPKEISEYMSELGKKSHLNRTKEQRAAAARKGHVNRIKRLRDLDDKPGEYESLETE